MPKGPSPRQRTVALMHKWARYPVWNLFLACFILVEVFIYPLMFSSKRWWNACTALGSATILFMIIDTIISHVGGVTTGRVARFIALRKHPAPKAVTGSLLSLRSLSNWGMPEWGEVDINRKARFSPLNPLPGLSPPPPHPPPPQ